MRVIIFLILFLTSQLANAQTNPLFKIISCSEGVTLDGVEVKPGLIVYPNSIKLEIPKNGYAGVMTIEGYASSLKESEMVKSINGKAKPFLVGSVIHETPYFTIIGAPSNQFAQIAGDSVFLCFKVNYKIDPPYIVKFLTMFDEVVLSAAIESNWMIFDIKRLLENEPAILFQLSSNAYQSENILFKKINQELLSKVRLEITRIPDDLIAKLALYELNKLFYDHLFQLYKIETTKNLNLDPISAAYLAKRREKYQLDQYNLK